MARQQPTKDTRRSRDVSDQIDKQKKRPENVDQYLVTIVAVVPDEREAIVEADRALEMLRGYGSADCVEAELLDATDTRRVPFS